MPMPILDEQGRKRPIGYDPKRKKFIRYDDVVSGKEKIVPLESLSQDDLKKLVIRRWQALPKDQVSQAISGPPYTRDDVIQAIRKDDPFGKMTVQAETAYLKNLLKEIESNLE